MKHFTATLKWMLIGIGAISAIYFIAEPSYVLIQSFKAGYLERKVEYEKIEEQKKWISADKIIYPIENEKFNNLDILKIAQRIKKEDPELFNFLFGWAKPPLEQGAIRKFHPDTKLLYDTCQNTINSDQWLTELYTYLTAEEILGLNSKMTYISGSIDSLSEKVGRDYIYSISDNQIKYLMEGINERGAQILQENLRSSEQKRQEYNIYLPSQSDFDIAKQLTKPMGHKVILFTCLAADIKMGLIGLGTNFQNRAQHAAEMVQRKIKIEKTKEYEIRRDKINETLEQLKHMH